MAQSIKLKNNNYLDSTSIVHNREILSDILNGKYLMAYLHNSMTINTTAWQQQPIPLTLLTNNTNGAITLSNGNLIIGDNVNTIEVSFSINIDRSGSANSYIFCRLLKNNLTYIQGISNGNNLYDSIGFTIIMPVSKGDVIGIGYVDNTDNSNTRLIGTEGTYFETYLSLKIIN